ncbi:MAG TPA: DUF4411 family protein [Candidatus Binatia bacterium]|jgi:hypothetical protein|nr:DUF4411 family protein [Candidatus Binatia bacterium]
MKYLIDSDTLIRAKNDFYPFDSVPAFWTWLERLNETEVVFSIDKVKQELMDEGDQLSNWVKMHGAFFLKTDGSNTQKALRDVAAWIVYHERYSESAKNTFLSCADYRLIGHAIALGATVITFEKDEPAAVERIKIPSVCKQFNIPCGNLWKLRKEYPSKFVME